MANDDSFVWHRAKISSKKTLTRQIGWHYRVMVALRFMLALFGGYFLAAMMAKSLAVAIPSIQASTVMGITMLAFMIHAAVFIWVFMVQSTLKAWAGVVLPTVFFYMVYLWFRGY